MSTTPVSPRMTSPSRGASAAEGIPWARSGETDNKRKQNRLTQSPCAPSLLNGSEQEAPAACGATWICDEELETNAMGFTILDETDYIGSITRSRRKRSARSAVLWQRNANAPTARSATFLENKRIGNHDDAAPFGFREVPATNASCEAVFDVGVLHLGLSHGRFRHFTFT